ncbi:MAG: leucyl/phenylalanyl-tRNA--protein transferase [Fimbriiglobus sp.]|jgi:leucyl/phenylalanyl-tRNA--protein transferase|nr:leucyl/phenylalanyl-tRNA--protein transferase [Fimbriiglobus sp.]
MMDGVNDPLNPFADFTAERPWMPPEFATPEGIVGVGGELTPNTLLHAYRAGVFPWFNPDDPVIWWSPDPRGIIPLDRFHVPRRLAATIRQNRFRVTVNTRFAEVMRACAENRLEGTWVTDEMVEGYTQLHTLGHAHSLEVWHGDELAGGVYGVSVGGLFAGESMFHRVRDASKVALVALLTRLRDRGFVLFDTQIVNDHTAQFGAHDIPRAEYLRRLRMAVTVEAHFGD